RGGVANAGQVVRIGGHVLRPSNPHSRSIHALLRTVRAAGFDGASLPVGVDAAGRERMVFIAGDVPIPPYPAWAQAGGPIVCHKTSAWRTSCSAAAWRSALWTSTSPRRAGRPST